MHDHQFTLLIGIVLLSSAHIILNVLGIVVICGAWALWLDKDAPLRASLVK